MNLSKVADFISTLNSLGKREHVYIDIRGDDNEEMFHFLFMFNNPNDSGTTSVYSKITYYEILNSLSPRYIAGLLFNDAVEEFKNKYRSEKCTTEK